jgi:hypothetical protein
LYCEALREAGILMAVFVCLDAAFAATTVSVSSAALVSLGGVVTVMVGIHLDPEV